ncbi:MAG: MFS transporter [Oscillatoria sp. PMC 1051.18]|nr:MFS transporter [Oscillatoria sp. PMC 1050.18]MEC5030949.1 MFS transporter [Oscillatoria sp. PMC 1051.18]
MKIFSTLERSQLRNLLFLFFSGLAFWTSLTSMLPTLPLYIEDLGAPPEQVGFVMGCFAIGLLLSRVWLGNLADRRSRKIVVVIGTGVAAIAPLGYVFFQSIPWLMVTRAFHGISIAAFTTAYSALVVDISPVKQRGELLGYMSLAIPLGMAFGPALGGFLQASVDYKSLFFIPAVLGAIAFLLAIQVREEQRFHSLGSHRDRESQLSQLWRLLASPRIRVPTIILLLIGTGFGILVSYLPGFMRDAAVDLNAGWYYSAAAIASFVARVMTGRASDRYGRGLFVSLSLVSFGLSMFLLAIAHSATAFALSAIFEGIGVGTLMPMAIAVLSDRSLPNERAIVYSLSIGGFDLGTALGGPFLGSLVALLTYRGLFLVATSLSAIALIIFLTQSSKDARHSFRFATGRGKDLYALEALEVLEPRSS